MNATSSINIKSPFEDCFPENYYIDYKIDDINTNVRMHFHAQYEFVLCIDDGVDFLLNGNIVKLKKNSLILFNNHDFHMIIGSNKPMCTRYVTMFRPEILINFAEDDNILKIFSEEELSHKRIIGLTGYQVNELTNALNRVIYYDNKTIKHAKIYSKLSLIELILKLNELVVNNNISKPYSNKTKIVKIEQILDYIINNLDGDLSTNTLSKKFYISKSYMNTLFKHSTGITINSYVIMQRIYKAKKLLETSNISVANVAATVGFNDYSHFLRTFKKHVGITPKQYSKMF